MGIHWHYPKSYLQAERRFGRVPEGSIQHWSNQHNPNHHRIHRRDIEVPLVTDTTVPTFWRLSEGWQWREETYLEDTEQLWQTRKDHHMCQRDVEKEDGQVLYDDTLSKLSTPLREWYGFTTKPHKYSGDLHSATKILILRRKFFYWHTWNKNCIFAGAKTAIEI